MTQYFMLSNYEVGFQFEVSFEKSKVAFHDGTCT